MTTSATEKYIVYKSIKGRDLLSVEVYKRFLKEVTSELDFQR